jgi:hypothetical protein
LSHDGRQTPCNTLAIDNARLISLSTRRAAMLGGTFALAH